MRKLKLCMWVILMTFLLAGCGKKEHKMTYSFLTTQECADKLGSLDRYYDSISQKSLDFMTQKKGATKEEYKAFSVEQAREFSEDEKAILSASFEEIQKKMSEAGLEYPTDFAVTVAKTTMQEALGAAGYTHDTTIFLYEDIVEVYAGEYQEELVEILAHEIFHCLTRNNPEFRKEMYSYIGFNVNDSDFVIPDEVQEIMIANPDVGHHDSYATFMINGEKKDCYLVFLSSDVFENPGDNFFDNMYTGLVDVQDGTLYHFQEASDFLAVMGENTGYCEDPEECMADNFAYAIVYGKQGPGGDGYPTPEIIDKILAYLSKK